MNEKDESAFARHALRDFVLYSTLRESEPVSEFRDVLHELALVTNEQYIFWSLKIGERNILTPSRLEVFLYKNMRKFLGFTLTVKYILGRKNEQVKAHKNYCKTCTSEEDYKKIEVFSDRLHAITGNIKEVRVKFFSNIILGFNDALIELTGALVGFSFALRDTKLIVVGGLITGISASLSMAASAFLQAKHDEGKDPRLAALFTGVSYFVVSVMLVTPFLFAESIEKALGALAIVVVLLITLVSFYSAILLEKRYVSHFLQMLLLSLGVATIALIIGFWLNSYIF